MNEPWDIDKEMMRRSIERLIAHLREPELAAMAEEAAALNREEPPKRPRKSKKKEQVNA